MKKSNFAESQITTQVLDTHLVHAGDARGDESVS